MWPERISSAWAPALVASSIIIIMMIIMIILIEMKMNIGHSEDKMVSGKFTKSRKFRLHITALDFLAPYAQHKVHNSVKETVLRHTR